MTTESNIKRIEVFNLTQLRSQQRPLRQSFFIYQIYSKNKKITEDQVEFWGEEIFADPVSEYFIHNHIDLENILLKPYPCSVVEVNFLPGVTDNVGKTATEAIKIVNPQLKDEEITVYSGKIHFIYEDLQRNQIEKIAREQLGNPLLHDIKIYTWKEFNQEGRFNNCTIPEVKITKQENFQVHNLDISDDELIKMNDEFHWALSLDELLTIKKYYQDPQTQKVRQEKNLPLWPTDVEIEVLAQTWSEHCKHKIMGAEIDYSEDIQNHSPLLKKLLPQFGSKKIKSLYKTHIKGATHAVQKKASEDFTVSVFHDNAGIVRFDKDVDYCIKVETHNSPSALDPYGGSLTGIVGVNRDILGCGLGAKPIANMDVFCFAPLDLEKDNKKFPKELKAPRTLLKGVHQGIVDGGNKSGIPTVNGAIYFDDHYAGKPLVFCGTVGVIPQELSEKRQSSIKTPKPGDKIVMAGGRIGLDGIHGATCSSLELSEGIPSTIVQIGDPLTQKRLLDFTLEARDQNLFSSITDNGAGGLSSSIGEMAQQTGGAEIDVSLAPTKYPNIRPFELVISESQERMSFAVPPKKLDQFMSLAEKHGVLATTLGEFNDSGTFSIYYQKELVGELTLDFLHDGLPPMKLKAVYEGPKNIHSVLSKKGPIARVLSFSNSKDFEKILLTVIKSLNVASKEDLVRQYDHEVLAATIGKPFVGKSEQGPGNAGIIWSKPHGGDDDGAVALACGLNPRLSYFDTYLMALNVVDETIRNLVSVGVNPQKIALVDNFCWPDPIPSSKNPDAHHKLAQLVRACEGIYFMATHFDLPFVSGKDSMKNDFIGKTPDGDPIKISVPPTVLITGLGKIDDLSHRVSSDFKKPEDQIFLIGPNEEGLGSSELVNQFMSSELPLSEELRHFPPAINPELNKKIYEKVHESMKQNILSSCHDISDGGLITTVIESMIGGDCGAQLNLDSDGFNKPTTELDLEEYITNFLFNEGSGRFIVSISPEKISAFKNLFKDLPTMHLGHVTDDKNLFIKTKVFDEFSISLNHLSESWRKKW